MNKKQNKKSLKIIALVQVFSMILEIFAFSFILGGMVVWSSGSVDARLPDSYVKPVSLGFWSGVNKYVNPLSWTSTTLTDAQKQQKIIAYNNQVEATVGDQTRQNKLAIDPKPSNYDQLAAKQKMLEAYNQAGLALQSTNEKVRAQGTAANKLLDNPSDITVKSEAIELLQADKNLIKSDNSLITAAQSTGLISNKVYNDVTGNGLAPYANLANNYDYSGGIVGDIGTTIWGTVKTVGDSAWNVVAGSVNTVQAAATLNPGRLVANNPAIAGDYIQAQVLAQTAATDSAVLSTPLNTWIKVKGRETRLTLVTEGAGDAAQTKIVTSHKTIIPGISVLDDAATTTKTLTDITTPTSTVSINGKPLTPIEKADIQVENKIAVQTAYAKAGYDTKAEAMKKEIADAKDSAQTLKDAGANNLINNIITDEDYMNNLPSGGVSEVIQKEAATAAATAATEQKRLAEMQAAKKSAADIAVQQETVKAAQQTVEDYKRAEQILADEQKAIQQQDLQSAAAANTVKDVVLNQAVDTKQQAYNDAQARAATADRVAELAPTPENLQALKDTSADVQKTAKELADAKKAVTDNAAQGNEINKKIAQMTTEAGTNSKGSITTAGGVFSGLKGMNAKGVIEIKDANGVITSSTSLDQISGLDAEAQKTQYGVTVKKDGDNYLIENAAGTTKMLVDSKGKLLAGESVQTAKKYKTPFGDFDLHSPLAGNLLEGVSWGVVVLGISQLIAGFMGSEDKKSMVSSAGLAISAGLVAGKAVYGLIGQFGKNEGTAGKLGLYDGGAGAKWAGGITGAILAYYIFASQYTKTETTEQTIEFKCMTWQAPRGGASCDLCNHDALRPCSEYRCKSLGQTCKLLNAGTGEEKCIDSAPDDVTSPGIKPMESALTNGYSYTDVKNRPPGGNGPAGMKITYNGGCLPSFTPFKWGIVTTDNGNNGVELQPAQCKIDFNHTTSFDDMNYYMDENNLYVENHTQAMSLPGATLNKKENNSLEIKSNEEYTMYVRCMDGNGNENRDEFAVRFCIDPTPDLTAPIIKSTSIDSGSAVLYKVDNVSMQVYTNEPANCKWSRKDSSYSNMENNMSCSNSLWQMNAEMFYTCKTTLTSIKDKEQNDFYFRCQDLNNNTQQQSYAFTLYGTQPLNILSVGPTGTIGSSTSTANVTLTVKTDNGFSNGNSDCYYSTTNSNSSFVKMFETGGNTHSQSLDLVGGSYKYYYKCIDAGGNLDSNQTSFDVFVDKYAPAIVRAFQVSSKLYLVTDESSTCKYSTASCNFNMDSEGIDMPYANSVEHYSDLKVDQTYYIKCSDEFGNQPEPTDCSMIIRPYQLAKE